MVYRKKTYRKRYYRKKTYSKRPFTISGSVNAMDVAQAAWKSVKYIRGLVNSEMLKWDSNVTLDSNQSRIVNLTAIAQGDGANTRTGNSILVRNIAMRGWLEINNAVNNNTRVMMALVQDTQQLTDTSPSVADIFASATSPTSLLNNQTLGRFKILKRWNYTLLPVSAGQNVKQVEFYKTLYFHTRYNGSATTDIQKNGLYLVIITSENANYPIVNMNVRVGYHDN